MRFGRKPRQHDAARSPFQEAFWSTRLRFLVIPLVFAGCWWVTFRGVEGRVSFAWASELQNRVDAITAPLQPHATPPRASSATLPPLPVSQRTSSAQPVPTPTIAPLVFTAPVPPVATSTPLPAERATATAAHTPEGTAHATATRLAATREATGTPDGAREMATPHPDALLSGPHTIYVIQAGDTLTAIARRYGTTASALADYNHLQPPYKLVRGARLYIPAA